MEKLQQIGHHLYRISHYNPRVVIVELYHNQQWRYVFKRTFDTFEQAKNYLSVLID